MKKQINKILIVLLVAFLMPISSFFDFSNFASAEELIFTLDTNGYVAGTWTNQDVTVEIDYYGGDDESYEYSFEPDANFVEFTNQATFSQEGSYYVFFRIVTTTSTSQTKALNIRIDKTAPEITYLFSNPLAPTNQNVTITVVTDDNLSGVNEYNFGGDWQSLNTFEAEQNIVFEVGQIIIRDRAGNEFVYNSVVSVNNIYKSTPIINLVADTQSIKTQEQIEIILNQVEPGLQSFVVTTPSGNQIDIKQTYENGFVADERGTYVFTITTLSGQTASASILFKNIFQIKAWQSILIYSSLTIVGAVFLTSAINETRKRLKNKNN